MSHSGFGCRNLQSLSSLCINAYKKLTNLVSCALAMAAHPVKAEFAHTWILGFSNFNITHNFLPTLKNSSKVTTTEGGKRKTKACSPSFSALSLKGTERRWTAWTAEYTEAYKELGKRKNVWDKLTSTNHVKNLNSDMLFSAVPASLMNSSQELNYRPLI